MFSDWLSRLAVVPGLFLELLPLLLLLLWLLYACLWVLLLLLLLLQLHALLQAAGSPHAALQPAVTTSSALSRQRLQFGCSQVTRQQEIHSKRKTKKQRRKNKWGKTKRKMQKITYDDFMQKILKSKFTSERKSNIRLLTWWWCVCVFIIRRVCVRNGFKDQ